VCETTRVQAQADRIGIMEEWNWNNGIVEEWNNGRLVCVMNYSRKVILSFVSTQHSIIPAFHNSAGIFSGISQKLLGSTGRSDLAEI